MIKDVPLTGIFVDDQEAALDFYTHRLGLDLIQDEPYGESARWITVSPKGAGIRIVLKKAEKEHEKAMVGRSDGAPVLTLGTDDLRSAYEELRGRGVRFLGEPYRYLWGLAAILLDQDGSPVLLQQAEGAGDGRRLRGLGKEASMHGRDLRARDIASVDEYLDLLGYPQGEVAARLRAIVRTHYPQLREDVKWHVPVYSLDTTPIVSIEGFKMHVNLKFFKGAVLQDRAGILEGTG